MSEARKVSVAGYVEHARRRAAVDLEALCSVNRDCDPQMPQSGSLRVADLEDGKEAKIRALPLSARRFQTLGVKLDFVPNV